MGEYVRIRPYINLARNATDGVRSRAAESARYPGLLLESAIVNGTVLAMRK